MPIASTAEEYVFAYHAGSAARAELARIVLRAAGVPAVVSDEAPQADDLLAEPTLESGRRVFVPVGDYERALAVLRGSSRMLR